MKKWRFLQDGVKIVRRYRTSVFLQLGVGIVLTVGMFFFMRVHEAARATAEEVIQTRHLVSFIQHAWANHLDQLGLAGDFLTQKPPASSRSLEVMAQSILAAHPAFLGLAWLPHASQEGRETENFPITWLEPGGRESGLLGLDMMANPVSAPAMRAARTSGEAMATSRITLGVQGKKFFGCLVFQPIFQRREAGGSTPKISERFLVGFVMAFFDVEAMVSTAVGRINGFSPLSFDLVDESASLDSSKRKLHWARQTGLTGTLTEPPFRQPARERLMLGGQPWSVGYAGNETRRHLGLAPWLTLAGGLALTLFLTMLSLTLTGSTEAMTRMKEHLNQEAADRTKVEGQFLHAQRMESVSRLVSGLAHDLKNHLTVIAGYTSLVRETLPEGDAKHTDLGQVMQAADQARTLTHHLMTFAHQPASEPGRLNLCETLTAMEGLLRQSVGEDLEWSFHVAPDVGWIRVDQAHLQQALINLVLNAREAMPKGGRLSLEASKVKWDQASTVGSTVLLPGHYVQVMIKDNGIGMPEALRARVVNTASTTKEGRSGLGLSAVYRIVKHYGGGIEVQSQEGLGTVVKLFFPSIQPTSEGPAPATSERSSGNPKTILVVEDEAAVRGLAVRVLREKGYEVWEASSGEEALQLIFDRADQPIDLLITDAVMPRMGGWALMEKVRNLHPSAKMLLTSGYTSAALEDGHLRSDVLFLQKPFSPSALTQMVYEIFSLPDVLQGSVSEIKEE